MPSHVKTNNKSEDPEDHLKVFQAAAKTERWVMPRWCHMFNSTLTRNARVWFDDLSPESINSYDDLREAFLKNYLQQKKCIRYLIVLYNIKQRDGESTEDFIQRYKSESGNVKGAPECMRISGFVHRITNPELTLILNLSKDFTRKFQNNRRNDAGGHIFPSRARGGLNHKGKKTLRPGNTKKGSIGRISKKEGGYFRNHIMQEKRPDKVHLLDKNSRRRFRPLEKGKFKTPPPMTPKPRLKSENAKQVLPEFHEKCWEVCRQHNPGAEAKQRKRPAEKERRNLQKRETSGNSNDSVTTKGFPARNKMVLGQITHSVNNRDMNTHLSALMDFKVDATSGVIPLGEVGKHYRPGVSLKDNELADFIVERPEKSQDDSAKEEEPLPAQWTLFTDGHLALTDADQE
ncbi:reverse transcriptase domain-containing protein [Tanacetum coccineum]|uniref:Reverse transcriptase domain-containing protein n=1 Tax=Tanacetum coccineum TaxID=301880 RepID=A0ABQ5CNC0_9ASTR